VNEQGGGPELSPIPREARRFQGEAAGIITRFVANTIDALVVGAALGALYLGVSAVIFMLDPRAFEFPAVTFLASLTTALFMATFYLWIAWWLLGRSYGGHVMGIRVSGRRGRKLGPLRALARAGFCVFFPIGLFWCVISPRRRSVQDVVLFTKVVYDWSPRPGRGVGALAVTEPTTTGPPVVGDPTSTADPASLGGDSRPSAGD
jgi:uncharacterized RDD family membrane protein YckC